MSARRSVPSRSGPGAARGSSEGGEGPATPSRPQRGWMRKDGFSMLTPDPAKYSDLKRREQISQNPANRPRPRPDQISYTGALNPMGRKPENAAAAVREAAIRTLEPKSRDMKTVRREAAARREKEKMERQESLQQDQKRMQQEGKHREETKAEKAEFRKMQVRASWESRAMESPVPLDPCTPSCSSKATAPVAPPKTQQSGNLAVVEWLASVNLGQYADQFIQHGFDDLELLQSLDSSEFDQMCSLLGLLAGHKMKLRKALQSC